MSKSQHPPPKNPGARKLILESAAPKWDKRTSAFSAPHPDNLSDEERVALAERIGRLAATFREGWQDCHHYPRCCSSEWHCIELAKDQLRGD